MARLEIKGLSVEFTTREGVVKAVDSVSLVLEPGIFTALVGETGCGKTSLAHAVLGLLPGNARLSGRILYGERDLLSLSEKDLAKIRAREIALIPQNPGLSLNPVYSVGHQLCELYRLHANKKRSQANESAVAVLRRLGFGSPETTAAMYPSQFSEGMNQRVMMAAALTLSPKIILADEPSKGLDEKSKADVLKELAEIKRSQTTGLCVITHDLEAARELCDSFAVMYAGEIIETGCKDDLFQDPWHPYTQALLAALPENGFTPIPGFSPSPISPPQGCRFHPRCAHKMDRCGREKPDLEAYNDRKMRCYLNR